jgi:hypothetical protein
MAQVRAEILKLTYKRDQKQARGLFCGGGKVPPIVPRIGTSTLKNVDQDARGSGFMRISQPVSNVKNHYCPAWYRTFI